MSDLLDNINALHTTELGAERIRRNLNLPVGKDVVLWCKEAVEQHDLIMGLGNNWCVYTNGVVITINQRNNTIITAKPINARVRVMQESAHE